MPFPMALRSSEPIEGSYRGPPAEAAVTCAATPMFSALVSSVWGPLVRLRHVCYQEESFRATVLADELGRFLQAVGNYVEQSETRALPRKHDRGRSPLALASRTSASP